MRLGRKVQRQTLEAMCATLHTEREQILQRVPALQWEEQELRREELRKGNRSDSKGALSESTRKRNEWQKLERKLPAIDAEIAAAAVVLEELRAEEAAAEFVKAQAGVEELNARERAQLDKLMEARHAFAAEWDTLTAIYGERREYAGQFSFADQAWADEMRAATQPAHRIGVHKFDYLPPQTPAEAFVKFDEQAAQEAEPTVNVVQSRNWDLFPAEPEPQVKPSYLAAWAPGSPLRVQMEQEQPAAVEAILEAAEVPAA